MKNEVDIDKWQQLKERREIELQEAVKLFDEAEKIRNPEKYKKGKSRKRYELLYLFLIGIFFILLAIVRSQNK